MAAVVHGVHAVRRCAGCLCVLVSAVVFPPCECSNVSALKTRSVAAAVLWMFMRFW